MNTISLATWIRAAYKSYWLANKAMELIRRNDPASLRYAYASNRLVTWVAAHQPTVREPRPLLCD